MRRYLFFIAFACVSLCACSQRTGQFAAWQDVAFPTTRVTQRSTMTVHIANESQSAAQHVTAVAIDHSTNSGGHFSVDEIRSGDKVVGNKDIVIAPGATLALKISYEPRDVKTTVASYGGWSTGQPTRWKPRPVESSDASSADASDNSAPEEAIHRALVQILYDAPREGIAYVHLVGWALPGPRGELVAGGLPGECAPGDGIACYDGGFAIDIPKLVPDGPKQLEMLGKIPLRISGGQAKMVMDDFPLTLMVLRSSEVPQLPSGVSATLVISGAPGITAEGTFDGARLELQGVSFRIRAVLGEVTAEQARGGLSAVVDFTVNDLHLTTTAPLSQGKITLHVETTLSDAPSGNELFDQFLSGADVIVFMEGQLEM